MRLALTALKQTRFDVTINVVFRKEGFQEPGVVPRHFSVTDKLAPELMYSLT